MSSATIHDIPEGKVELNVNTRLGEGAFGNVYSGLIHFSATGKRFEVAVKKLKNAAGEMDEDELCVQRELTSLTKLSHENIVKLFCSFRAIENPENTSRFYYRYIVMELCKTDLSTYMKKTDEFADSIQMPSNVEVLLQIARGLEYIHSQGFVHRDIKPNNILIYNKDIPATIKIADFGFTKPVGGGEQGKFSLSTVDCGTQEFHAPEIYDLIEEIENSGIHPDDFSKVLKEKGKILGREVDIFSTGCTFYFFVAGLHPFGCFRNTIVKGITGLGRCQRAKSKEESMLRENPSSYALLEVALGMIERESAQRTSLNEVLFQLSKHKLRTQDLDINKKKLYRKGPYGSEVFKLSIGTQEIAIKRLIFDGGRVGQETRHEDCKLLNLSHSNLLLVYQIIYVETWKYVAMELCAGNLEDYFSGTYNGNMPRESEALLQMSEGMAFIHSKKLVHGELRPSNILISNDSPVQLKLSEFGISEELSQFDETSVIPLKLLKYRAPELFPEDEETMQQTTNKPDAKCDVFAMGCLFHEFVTRGEGHPFSENKNDDVNISLNIVLGKFNLDGPWPAIDNWITNLIVGMIAKNREERKQSEAIVEVIRENQVP